MVVGCIFGLVGGVECWSGRMGLLVVYLVWWVKFSVGVDGWWLLVVYLVWWVELSVGVDGWWLLVVYLVWWVEFSVGVDG